MAKISEILDVLGISISLESTNITQRVKHKTAQNKYG